MHSLYLFAKKNVAQDYKYKGMSFLVVVASKCTHKCSRSNIVSLKELDYRNKGLCQLTILLNYTYL